MFWAWPCKQQHRESCAIMHIYSGALLVWAFSLHLLNESGYDLCKKASFPKRRDDPDPGPGQSHLWLPYATHPFGRGKGHKVCDSSNPKKRRTQSKVENTPHFHNAHTRGLRQGRRLERRAAKAGSCIRNFLLRTVWLLSHFHGWRAADPRAHNLVLGPGRRVTGPRREPQKKKKKKIPRRGRSGRGRGARPHRPRRGAPGLQRRVQPTPRTSPGARPRPSGPGAPRPPARPSPSPRAAGVGPEGSGRRRPAPRFPGPESRAHSRSSPAPGSPLPAAGSPLPAAPAAPGPEATPFRPPRPRGARRPRPTGPRADNDGEGTARPPAGPGSADHKVTCRRAPRPTPYLPRRRSRPPPRGRRRPSTRPGRARAARRAVLAPARRRPGAARKLWAPRGSPRPPSLARRRRAAPVPSCLLPASPPPRRALNPPGPARLRLRRLRRLRLLPRPLFLLLLPPPPPQPGPLGCRQRGRSRGRGTGRGAGGAGGRTRREGPLRYGGTRGGGRGIPRPAPPHPATPGRGTSGAGEGHVGPVSQKAIWERIL